MPLLLQDAVLEIQSWQTTGSATYTSCIISRIFLVLARCRLGIQVSSRCWRSCDAKTSVIGCHAGRCWWWGQRSSNTCHEIWIGTCFLPKIRQQLANSLADGNRFFFCWGWFLFAISLGCLKFLNPANDFRLEDEKRKPYLWASLSYHWASIPWSWFWDDLTRCQFCQLGLVEVFKDWALDT